MSARVVAIVQARLGSTRFPRKVLADIGRHTIIQHVVQRARAIHGVHVVIVAVPDDDDELIAALYDADIPVFGGPSDDVLKRYAMAARLAEASWVMRITGDCPLFAPDVASALLGMVARAKYQPTARRIGTPGYVSNDVSRSGFPDGTDCELFPASALFDADKHATSAHDREHVTPFIRRAARRELLLKSTVDCSSVKLSVDTPNDLDRVRAIYAKLPNKANFSFAATRVACGFNFCRQIGGRQALQQ